MSRFTIHGDPSCQLFRGQLQFITKTMNSTATGTIFCLSHHIILVQLQERVVRTMELNEAVSKRLDELLKERGMTQYQLYMKSGVPKSTIGNVINCAYGSVKLRIIHEMCQGMEISLCEFFCSPLFEENNLEP